MITLKLIWGNCIEVMKDISDKSIDLIVTDPPYGLNYNRSDLAMNREKIFGGRISKMKPNPIKYGDNEKESYELLENMLHEAKRILKKGAICAVTVVGGGGGPNPLFAKWALLLDKIIGFKQAIVWDKGGLGMGMQYRRSYEFVLLSQNGNPSHRWNGGNSTSNLWKIPKIIPSKYDHPTQKPIALMERIISLHSNKGDIILDPFLGSGTTMLAALNLERNCVGIEIDKKYIDMTKKRLNWNSTLNPEEIKFEYEEYSQFLEI